MRVFKRLYLFILKSFLPLFAMTFFIVLFIVLMQFLWKYIDDLVGKGLTFDVLAELFFYAAVSMVPMALPLAILLASLMTFGNLGEKSELTAIKASGISLIHVMRPLIILIMTIAVGAFFFQNDILPRAQVKMYTLLFSVRQKSPELEIPEGVFYSQIPGYNIYVKSKNRETGMLYDVMIYDVSKGGDNSTILLADSARISSTRDARYLYLHLFTGEQFENLREQKALDRNVPFRRETFLDKEVLISFDANFTRLDEGGMRNQYVGKNITELRATIDSISERVDSLGRDFAGELKKTAFPIAMPYTGERTVVNETLADNPPVRAAAATSTTSAAKGASPEKAGEKLPPLDFDSIFNTLKPVEQVNLLKVARNFNESRSGETRFKAQYMADEKKSIRRHQIELIKKFTLSVACIIFFFIGAPLGAIIRKGGLGTPLVISVLLFLVYYIIDNTGYKMARDGRIEVWIGMWLSTAILLPLGIYVTIKAMNDSSVFNKDLYIQFVRRLFGLREKRSLQVKDVIIDEVNPAVGIARLSILYTEARKWLRKNRRPLGYVAYWMKGYDIGRIMHISALADQAVEYLSDSRDVKVIDKLSSMPVVKRLWVYHPVSKRWLRLLMMYFIPVGIPVYLLSITHRKRLHNDMQTICTLCCEEIRLLS